MRLSNNPVLASNKSSYILILEKSLNLNQEHTLKMLPSMKAFRMPLLLSFLIFFLFHFSNSVIAQTPNLVTDINMLGGGHHGNTYGPAEPTAVLGSSVIYTGGDVAHGSEIWMSNGTIAGTILLKDCWTGTAGSTPKYNFANGGKVYFSAYSENTGRELWVTDGTAAGTMMLKDIWPGQGNGNPTRFGTLGTKVLFAANDSVNGTELWITDGTPIGTFMVKDIRPGSNASFPIEIMDLGAGIALFVAYDTGGDQELWRTDGTTAGTFRLKDINTSGNSSPNGGVVMNGVAYFNSTDGVNGFELWKSDGTVAGTVLIKDIYGLATKSRTFFLRPMLLAFFDKILVPFHRVFYIPVKNAVFSCYTRFLSIQKCRSLLFRLIQTYFDRPSLL